MVSALAHDAGRRLEASLRRGFTTVRDAGGANFGLAEALRRRWVRGPRRLYCGHAPEPETAARATSWTTSRPDRATVWPAHIGRVVDSADKVRRAVRDEFRRAASSG